MKLLIWCDAHHAAVQADSWPRILPVPVADAIAAGRDSAPLGEWSGDWVVDLSKDGLYCELTPDGDEDTWCRAQWFVIDATTPRCECGNPEGFHRFDRSVCACGWMHTRCNKCGKADSCEAADMDR